MAHIQPFVVVGFCDDLGTQMLFRLKDALQHGTDEVLNSLLQRIAHSCSDWHHDTKQVTDTYALDDYEGRYDAILRLNGMSQQRFEDVMSPLWEITQPLAADDMRMVAVNFQPPWLRITMMNQLAETHPGIMVHPQRFASVPMLITIFMKIALYLARHENEAIPVCMRV